ncbi:universal stress protein [Microvirga sp. STR05]|uniref:Universal stress protein n=1 Tax=Hymenobacter duratus TaxID=2771356 RepID=A0ABR8JCN8_9BACT|nr:universal stress protein [Hymenobacter duratus]MBD2714555.1 universal stress protein [Hymenobacter duratus]MBR7949459.1 universal stress protein [Microvirga sp. STR05]
MKPNLVVLTDFSPAAERARVYAAALAVPLQAEVHLVHVYYPQAIPLDFGTTLPVPDSRYVQETRQSLEKLAAAMPQPATAEVLETTWQNAVEQALAQYHPLVLVAGLTATDNLLDEWLSNRALPLAHSTGYPLLLVPEHLPADALQPPRRLALAIEDQPFRLKTHARAIAPLLDEIGTEILAVCVLPYEKRSGGWRGLQAAQQCGLTSAMPRCSLHKVIRELPASGILQGVDEVEADLIALLDQGHGWLHKLFHGSVTEYILRHTQVPVLLLAAHLDSGAE